MLTKCVEYSQIDKPPKPKPELKPDGRLSFKITNVGMDPWMDSGGDVFFNLNITLGEGAPVTLNFFEYTNNDRYPFKWDKLEVNWRGKKQIFEGSGKPIKLKIIQRGRKFVVKKKVHMRPGDTITVYRQHMQVYDIYLWSIGMILKFEYTDRGNKISELSPVMAPSDYWRSFKEMEQRVPAKRRR